MENSIQNIVLIGAGNVATHLALAFYKSGLNIFQIYNRSLDSAQELAEKVQAQPLTDLHRLNLSSDLYIISVADNAMEEVTTQLDLNDKLVVHTSGSVQMDVLKEVTGNYGVFYPLQTFSKIKDVEFRSIPICLEANNGANLQKLNELAKRISENVRVIDSEQRKVLHLAAVFACNFPNFMYSIAAEITNQSDIDFDILRPLIKETADKILEINPREAQTGPAKRGDKKTMNDHLEMLSEFPEFKEIYKLISLAIQTQKHRTQNTKH